MAKTQSLRLRTGITGLDDILWGGLPAGHVYLIEGDPGSGKTTMGLQFLLQGVANGERAHALRHAGGIAG
jgi:circadian clock protein KaiC